jgi:hypothetical protein
MDVYAAASNLTGTNSLAELNLLKYVSRYAFTLSSYTTTCHLDFEPSHCLVILLAEV